MSSNNEFNDAASPEKEDAVRKALGVEKRFAVDISIPTVGIVHLARIVVNAIDEDEAAAKAKELALSGEVDADGYGAEEDQQEHDYADSNEWNVEVSETLGPIISSEE